MKLLSAIVTAGFLTGFSWAACPVANPAQSVAGQGVALEDLRHTGYRYYKDGQYQIAAVCYTAALQMAEALGINNAAVAIDMNNIGALAEGMGNYSTAGDYYLRELDLLARLGEAKSERAGNAYTKLGQVMQIQGRYSEAEINYKKGLDLLTQRAGVENWRTANALNRLGRLYLEQGKIQEASNMLPKARAIAEKTLPEDNPLLITFFDSEAYLLCQSRKFKEAEKNWMTALTIAERAYGGKGIEYSGLLLHIGQMYLIIGDYSAAETMLRRGLDAEKKIAGADPLEHAILVSSLALAYAKQRKLAEAEPLILESAETLKATCSASPIACAFARSNLGEYHMMKGQWKMAEGEFELALKLREDTLGEHPLVADSLMALSRAMRKVKRKREAKIYEARAAQIVSTQRNPLYDGRNTIDVRAFQAENR
jgi:tetratricopeptide (TPR) repeat protein